MTHACSPQFSHELRIRKNHECSSLNYSVMGKGRVHLVNINLSSVYVTQKDASSFHLLNSIHRSINPVHSRRRVFVCRSVLLPGGGNEIPVLKSAAVVLTRSYDALRGSSLLPKLIPAISIIAFAAWGVGPLLRLGRVVLLHRTESSWKKSSVHYVMTSYLQPLLLWMGAMLICRALDPVVLPTEASQAVKQRLLNFVKSLSTVLAFACCLSSLIEQTQKFFMDSSATRNMGFSFAGKAVYTAVWVAAVSLFMELLGFSTQKWLTAGGLGTVLITLAGREIFTNFLSSVMIHTTRPFVVNEWIQTKIEGYEVSGTVEHVGWWSPTIIRGDDREAVHIPNHKFTVNVVRNLSQKTHWRIKTHLAVSHLDVNKINIVVADMRKVLSKNPQIEQQRLHRRVFLENIDPENQALMILVSCFVKTSRFEEYLCVKEAILLDLLRVVSHHGARLATPIRTVQKLYNEADLENIPFADAIFTRSRAASKHPYLLVEPSYKINNDDKASIRSVRSNEEKDVKNEEALTSDSKSESKAGIASTLDSITDKVKGASTSDSTNSKVSASDPQIQDSVSDNSVQTNSGMESVALDSDGGPKARKSPVTKLASGNERAISPSKQDVERSFGSPSIGRPSLEENIVLGVALEGSKRTLPIEEEMTSSPISIESKELVGHRNGNGNPHPGKDTDGQIPLVPNAKKSDLTG